MLFEYLLWNEYEKKRERGRFDESFTDIISEYFILSDENCIRTIREIAWDNLWTTFFKIRRTRSPFEMASAVFAETKTPESETTLVFKREAVVWTGFIILA